MHGSHWLMPSSGPLVLTWSLRTLFSPDQTNAGSRPSRAELVQAEGWTPRAGRRINADNSFLDTVREIESLRKALNFVFEALQQHVNIRFIEVDESTGSMGHFRIWIFENPGVGFFEAQTAGQARFPMGHGLKYIKLLDGRAEFGANHLIPHEIGHLLGLKHPWHGTHHDWDTDGKSEHDSKNRKDTVMSYNTRDASGWQELELRLLKLIYGAAPGADGPNPPPGHVPLAKQTPSPVKTEEDLFDDRSFLRVQLLNLTKDKVFDQREDEIFDYYKYQPTIQVNIFPDDTGSKRLLDVKFNVAGGQVANSRVSPRVDGVSSELFELRATSDQTTFSFYVKDVDKLPFYSSFPGYTRDFDNRLSLEVNLYLGPQFNPFKMRLNLTTAPSKLDGEFLISGHPLVGQSLEVRSYEVNGEGYYREGDDQGYQNEFRDDTTFEWRRDGDDTILSREASYTPATPGIYKVKIGVPDPKWRYTFVTEKQIEVRADHDPKQDYDVVRFEDVWPPDPENPLKSVHTGTDAVEWFDIERQMTVSGGGGNDIFAPNWRAGVVTIADFTQGEDRIWLYSLGAGPSIAFRHVDTNEDEIVDTTEIGRAHKQGHGWPVEFTSLVVLRNFTEELEESDFLTDGGDLLLAQWPDVV